MKRLLMMLGLGAALCSGAQAAQIWSVKSPHARTEFVVRTTADGGLEYQVVYTATEGQRVDIIGWSRLGIVTKLSRDLQQKEWTVSDLSKTVTFQHAEKTQGADVYTMVTGKRLSNNDAWRQISLTFKDDETGRLMRLDVRAYDTGVAFRYVLPETSLFFHKLVEEKTEFNIGLGGTHWGQPYDFVTISSMTGSTCCCMKRDWTPPFTARICGRPRRTAFTLLRHHCRTKRWATA